MGTFCRGWKRKAAYSTLVLTCSVAFLWFRSYFAVHVLNIPVSADEYFQLCCTSQNVNLSRMSITRTGERAQSAMNLWYSVRIQQFPGESRNLVHLHIGNFSCYTWQIPSERYGVVTFDMGVGTIGEMYQAKGNCRAIPYWLIILPLTLLSAGLLISSLRPPNLSCPKRGKSEEPFDGTQNQPLKSHCELD